MKLKFVLLSAAVLAGSLSFVSAADVTGKVTLKGVPPPEKEIAPLVADPNCGKLHTDKKPTTRFYVVGKDGGLADVFIYIREGAPKGAAAPAKPAVLDQKGCEYIPYVLGAQTGQKIVVKNSDPVMHNVHPTPIVPGNQEKNRAQMPNGPDLEFSWTNPEVFLRFKCDVHPWMFAYVGLVDNPYFAVTDEKGEFKIANLPPGKYVIEAFHRKAGKVSKEITVGSDSQKADFTLEVK